jgi:hypothetical protein
MKKSLLIAQVASLAKDTEFKGLDVTDMGLNVGDYVLAEIDDGFIGDIDPQASKRKSSRSVDANSGGGAASIGLLERVKMSSQQKVKINELLGAWEEPEILSEKSEASAPISAIIQFRHSCTYLSTTYPFSVAFGPVSDRTECIESAESVYHRLVGTDALLKFDLLAMLAIDKKGDLDQDKVRSLLKLFRPNREGTLTLIDFVKSIDTGA